MKIWFFYTPNWFKSVEEALGSALINNSFMEASYATASFEELLQKMYSEPKRIFSVHADIYEYDFNSKTTHRISLEGNAIIYYEKNTEYRWEKKITDKISIWFNLFIKPISMEIKL